jgi:DNA-binding CsgD family transcriptional regulator
MERLAQSDFARLLAFIGDCYAVRELDGFAAHVVVAIRRLVPADLSSYSEAAPGRGELARAVSPEQLLTDAQALAFNEHMAEHPLIREEARKRDGRTRKISDFLSQPRFHDLGLYTEFYRHVDIEYQMAVGLPARRARVTGITLNRSLRDFSERERLMLDLARPHLVQSYRSAETMATIQRAARLVHRALEETDHAVVVVSHGGRPFHTSPRAQECFARYFADQRHTGRQLPDMLARWIRRHHAVGVDSLPAPREPLVVESEGRRLVVRHVCDREACLLLFHEQVRWPSRCLERLGLTRREAEVLAWLAEGKTNPEIALILDTRPKTVSKHLERIYRKLGVETRTAAAAAVQAGAGALR